MSVGTTDRRFWSPSLLDGDSLRAVLDSGALPQRKTIEYGVQIAHGLAAAHEKGIVHRDLKPENVFITKDGRIKILDFGLAKLAQKLGGESDEVTLTSSHTAAGVVVGTASYMAPEQVRGETADPRTDIFAFGALLYEMLSGLRAFRRDTAAETMTAVLKEDPQELSNASRLVSTALERIVRRCLEKSPEQRFQSARDLSFALSALSGTETSSVARATGAAPRRLPFLIWLGAPLALAAVSGVTWFVARRSAPITRMQFAIPVPEEMSVSHMALSRDGSMLVFVSPEESSALPMLYVQRIGSSSVTRLPGTQHASFPFWSPDGAYVAFFANGKLQKVAISGGTPQVLANALAARGRSHLTAAASPWTSVTRRPTTWMSGSKAQLELPTRVLLLTPPEEVVGIWSRDGSTLAYRGSVQSGTSLFLKRATGLERERARLTLPQSDDIFPNSWSLDDQQILYTHQTSSSYYLELVPTAGGEPTRFLTSNGSESNGQISPDGKWVSYASDESGNWEIYVTSFPGAAGKWQLSRGGGTEPRWRGDGKEIFYIAPGGMLMAVPVNAEGIFATGTPTPLFQIRGRAPISSTDVFTYDVAKDGKRFLVNRYVKPEHVPPLTILLDTSNATPSP
jgi:hypothetical protein